MTAIKGYQLGKSGKTGAILCAREHLNSIDESSLEEVKQAIKSIPWLDNYYDVGETYVRSRDGRIKYIFSGLRRNLDSIKSKSTILIAWVEEAENVPEAAWRKLIPTVRAPGSEIWLTWNRESEESATNQRFIVDAPENSIIIEVNWDDNPWFPAELEQERQNDLKYRPEIYNHVWEGDYLNLTDAQIFKGKAVTDEFEVGKHWDGPYIGVDWGFSVDPTVIVKCWIHGRTLYISEEAGGIGIELDDIPGTFDQITDVRKHKIRADNARPETISHIKRKGFDIDAASKWPGSVEDGIELIKSFDRVVIHPDCAETAREFRLYSYKVDPNTEEVTTKIVDSNNHYIDAIRYALQPMIAARKKIIGSIWTDALIEPSSEPPLHWPRWRAMHWTEDRRYSVGWYARNPATNHIRRYRELCGEDGDVATVAERIKAIEAKDIAAGVNFGRSPANDDLWAKHHSIASLFLKEGVRWSKHKVTRDIGATMVLEAMKRGEFSVTDNCAQFIKSIPELREDDKHPGAAARGEPCWEELILSIMTYSKSAPNHPTRKKVNPFSFDEITK